MTCRRCGEEILENQEFCAQCGTKVSEEVTVSIIKNKSKKPNKKIFLLGGVIVGIIVVGIGGFLILKNSSSPIENVSTKVYNQGMDYLEEMFSKEVEDQIKEYISDHTDVPFNKYSSSLSELEFAIVLDSNATLEEELFKEIVDKVWMYTCVSYAKEDLIKEYEGEGEVAEIVVSVFKESVAEIDEATDKAIEDLKESTDISDLERIVDDLDALGDGE